MGKRARKTRWRALDIADDHSDSEESNTNSSAVSSRYSHSNGYYSKYSYSSQSTPARRRYNQYDGSTKSTRSSSTTSENKITFNEDEYTRITTPRQDVLFKKGYLNKPKSYHTQTSTGNSTISTGNSTENGTPDHQSADLDYESQFVFPNGFLDQNGIYYVNSYEPYPLMLFNPPTYYHECSNSKSKRYSTGSLSESMSPNNEEVTSQDLSQSGGEASNSGVSDYSGGPPVYNMVYPGYYVNGACTPTDTANCHHYPPEPVKKLKKRRERKSSKTIPGDSSEYTDENSGDELPETATLQSTSIAEHQRQEVASRVDGAPRANVNETPAEPQQNDVENAVVNCINNETIKTASENSTNDDCCADKKTETNPDPSAKPSVLKPDAEEFVPRVYHPLGPPPHIKMIPPNFMPIPLVPIGEFGGQNFAPHPAFIPPGIPINFIPHPLGQKIFPTAPGFVSYPPPIVHEAKIEETSDQNEVNNFSEEKERENIATPSHTPVLEESKAQAHSKAIDIATVVSKLEAVKQQERQDPEVVEADDPKPAVNESKPFRGTPRLAKPQNFKRNYYNKYRNSPVRSGEASPQIQNGGSSPRLQDSPHHFRQSPVRHVDVIQHPQISNEADARMHYHNSPVRHVQVSQPIKNVEVIQKPFEKTSLANGVHAPISDFSKQVRNSPERYHKKSWKPNGYQNNYGSPKRYQSNQTYQKPATNGYEKPYTNGYANSNKNYSESLRNGHQLVTNTPVKIVGPSEEQLKPKSNSQWISVSSRKKKKNKNVEDLDADTIDPLNDCADNTSDLFESYDVSQLVDVVPPSQLENHIPQAAEKRIEDILTSIAQSEVPKVLAIAQMTPININIPEVSDIEKNIIVKIEEENQPPVDRSEEKLNESLQAEEKTVHLDVTKDRELTPSELNESVEGEEEEEGFKPKKRSKKGTQKPLTKKVIITDIFNDLSVTPDDAKTPLKKIVKKIEEVKPVITEPQIPMATVDPEPQLKAKETTPELETEQLEKKSKKKKKNKAAKPICNGNNPVPDESCDILLENNLAVETLEKTNDEISLELDKLIQKGMYSSLQEKMKSINVEPAVDDFFKTIGAVVTPAKDKPTSTFKAPDFNRIFQSTRQFLKPNMVSVEHANTDIKVDVDDFDDRDTKACSSTADAANSSAGLVLDNAPEVQKALVDPEPPADEEIQDVEADKKLYPITQAVKEWMSKTRETTPEVEILKSPSAIQKEFGTTPGQDPNDLLDSDPEDEEITLFSSEETLIQDQPDLLEYWENDLPVVSKDCDLSKDIVCADGKSCDKCRNGSIKQDEEEIEVYESKYGQNEAFLHLQKEIVEKQKNAPGPGHLPYRAVCCSLQ